MTETASIDDPFEGFDVESGSEKDFLIANLRSDAPEEDVQQFIGAWKPWSLTSSSNVQDWDTTMDQTDFEETVRTALVSHIALGSQDWREFKFLKDAPVAEIDARIYELIRTEQDENGQTPLPSLEYPAPYLILQKKVEKFAQSHVFSANKHAKHTTLQRRDFARDIYDYARAIGMGRNQAKLEVQRARAAYRRDRGLVGGLKLDESDDESTLGLEIHDAAEYIAAMSNGMQHGPVDPAEALEEIRRLQAKRLDYSISTRKRKQKRAVLESHLVKASPTADEVASSRANRKALKRQKRRERKILERAKGKNGLDLGQPGGSMSQSKGQISTRQSLESIVLLPSITDFAGTIQNLPVASRGSDTAGSSEEKHGAEIFSFKDTNTLKNGVEEPWELRRKKKKKRKRKSVDHLLKTDISLEAETLVKPHHKDGAAKALSEQVHTNLDKSIEGRREKRTKNIKANRSQVLASGDPILDNFKLGSKADQLETCNDFDRDIVEEESASGLVKTTPRLLGSECEVVIHTPSKTWWSHVLKKSSAKAESIDLDSSTSILESTFSDNTRDQAFTMSERSLDWDHSGPEFDNIKVEPKVTRSSPLKSDSKTPTKSKSRDSSISLQTPESNRKCGHPISKSILKLADAKYLPDEDTSVLKKPAKTSAKSPFFSPPASAEKLKISPNKKPRQKCGLVSCIPFPPLSSKSFGLLQEKLWNDPFRLLIGVTFLNRTMGKHAIPVFFSLMERYPTPADILEADKEDIISMTHHLGLQAQRADTYKKFAHFWIHDPPTRGKRYRVDHYPNPGDGMDIKVGEVVEDDDPRIAWEIGHMTKGRYAIDSWRIFCRDVLRGEAEGWNGEGREDGFQPEWMRVQPRDKELIACLRWMWLKEGFSWDPETGEKEVADRKLMDAAIAGNITWDDLGGMRIVEEDCVDQEVEARIENSSG